MDCNDARDDVFPGATEECDFTVYGEVLDRDCDGMVNDAPADTDCASGNLCQVDFCNGGDACEFAPSGTCGISGTVYYGLVTALVDGPDPTKPVEGITIDLSGDMVAMDATDVNGQYAIPNVAGNVTLTAHRTNNDDYGDALSSLDAADIAQYSVGLLDFSPRQLVVGDVSNNTLVTSFDASQVAQRLVNPFFVFDAATAAASDWACFDVPQAFSPISLDETVNDLVCIVYGDVTLSWEPPMPASASAPGSPEAHGQGQGGISNLVEKPPARSAEAGSAGPSEAQGPARLYLAGAPQRQEDGSWEYVLGLENADGILAVDLKLAFDPARIELTGASTHGLASAMQVVSHVASPGRGAIAIYGAEPMQGTGEFLTLIVHGSVAGFPFDLRVEANEGAIPVRWGADLEPVSPVADAAGSAGGGAAMRLSGN